MYDKILDEQAEWFERNLEKVLDAFQKRIAVLIGDLETTNGILVYTDINVNQAFQSYIALQQMLQESGFGELIAKVQDKENDILRYMREHRPQYAVPFAFTAQTVEKLQGMSAIYATNFNGLAIQEIREIQQVITESVMAGVDAEECINRIRDILDYDFKRYAVTYFNTSRGDFIQAVEYANATEYEGELFWEYQGPLDDLTRPACKMGLGVEPSSNYPNAPFFTDEERIAFEAETAGDREYNCRHDFIQIEPEYYRDNVK